MAETGKNTNGIHFVSNLDLDSLTEFLWDVDDSFVPPLSQKVNINDYAQKLLENAVLIVALDGDIVFGLLALYCNDSKSLAAYIPIIVLRNSYKGRGFGKMLLQIALEYVKKARFTKVLLETWETNPAISFYLKNGFEIVDVADNRLSNLRSIKFCLNID